jgi:hypothetical protein
MYRGECRVTAPRVCLLLADLSVDELRGIVQEMGAIFPASQKMGNTLVDRVAQMENLDIDCL